MGAFIADAMGSYLEFNPKIASEPEMDECMTMPEVVHLDWHLVSLRTIVSWLCA